MIEDKKKLVSKAIHAGGWRLARKIVRSVPGVSTALAIGFIGYDIKQKGFMNGLINSGLDAIPIVGTVKNVAEMVTGDFLPDKKSKINKKIEAANQQNV
ncbi:MAG: hypothetical protein ACR2J3_07300 [Aridibacter sp.]